MNEEIKNLMDIILQGITMVGAAIAFGFTIYTWRNTNKVKRSEFLENLIREFNNTNTFLARRLLDDFWLQIEGGSELVEITDQQLIALGSSINIGKDDLSIRFNKLLRNHSDIPVTSPSEQRARQSFDDLLDFFTKLDYYLTLKLITKKELSYFQYYIERSANKAGGALLIYSIRYGYYSLVRLIYIMNIEVPVNRIIGNKKWLIENLNVNSKQRKFYDKLKQEA